MPRALMAGATDYSHQSFTDMVDDLNAWTASLKRTCEALESSEKHLQRSGYWEIVDFDVKSILGYAVVFFRTSVEEITEILAEIQAEVEDHHVTRLKSLAQTAIRLNRDLGQVWHQDPWERRKEHGEPDFEKAAGMYANARNMAADMMDLSNLAPRLKDFVGRKPSSDEKSLSTDDKLTILLMTADPTDDSRLRLGEELREIQEKLQLARLRDKFELHQRMSVRPADISQALLDVQPRVVHFSGHGAATGELSFEDRSGNTHPIEPDALAALFEQFASQVDCVVLNACHSEIQASAIAKHINYVIGMSQAIGDRAAIAFAIGFYQALGAGCTIEQAYELGCAQIRLQSIAEHLTPILIRRQVQS